MMAIANLVGFVVGPEGMKYLMNELFATWEGLKFMVPFCCSLFIVVQFMFEYRSVNLLVCLASDSKIVLFFREEELRQGIVRRC